MESSSACAPAPGCEHEPASGAAGVTAADDARDDERPSVHVEAVAHAVLRVVADFPGQLGRIRAARVVGGFALSGDPDTVERMASYWVDVTWPLRELVTLVDALVNGGLLTRTMGARPTLVLTRAGFRALEALEGDSTADLPGAGGADG